MALTARFWAFWGVVLGLPLAAFAVLMLVPEWDHSFGTMEFHFYVVSGTTLAAALAFAVVVGLMESL